ncbi:MAG: Gfo/Idh/MocA family oxidoreductase, partial [Chloroflexota bacterium]
MTTLSLQQKSILPTSPHPIVSIGAGGIVHDAHYPAYKKAGFSIAGLFDPNQERAAYMAQTFQVAQVYGSLEETVRQAPSDAVFDLAVPASAIPGVLREIPEGRGVLIQKPMGESLAQAKEIVTLCEQKSLTAAINFQMRTAPFIIAARDLITQGLIGKVHDLEVRVTVFTPWQLWTFLETVPYPEILYHSIHYIDLARSFLGESNGVYAKTVKHPDALKMDGTRTNIILDYGDQIR